MIEFVSWLGLRLGALGLILICAGGLGHVLLRRYQFSSLVERLVFTLALGLGVSALLIFVLGLAGLLYPKLLLFLTAAGALLTLAQLIRRKPWRLINFSNWNNLSTLERCVVAVLVLAGCVHWSLILLSALYPSFQYDAVSHHLVLSREFLLTHKVAPIIGIPHPVLPLLNHMLFTWAMALQDDIVAQLVEHAFLMLTAAGLFAWGKRDNRPAFGLALAALWLGHPFVLFLAQSAYVDVCLTALVFLGVYALRIFWDRSDTKWWYLGMALMGMAAGVKLPGLFFVVGGIVVGLLALARPAARATNVSNNTQRQVWTKPTIRAIALGCVLAVAILLPWYAFVSYHAGDPFYPSFQSLRRGEHGDPAAIQNTSVWLRESASRKTLANFLRLSVDLIRHPTRFHTENNLSFFPLIALWPLSWLAAFWNRPVRWWTIWAFAFTCFWFIFPPELRYWLPALPLAGVALYETLRWFLEKFTPSRTIQTFVWAGLIVAALAWGFSSLSKDVRGKGFPPPTNPEAREAHLSVMYGYKAVQYINSHGKPDETVCVMNGSWINYYLKPRFIDLSALSYVHRLPKFRSPDDTEWMDWLKSENVTWVYLNHARPPYYLKVPADTSIFNSIWPDYELVYSDDVTWVFKRKVDRPPFEPNAPQSKPPAPN